MSAIFTKHTSVPYVAKSHVVPAGNRKVVTIAKKDKNGNYGANLQVTHVTNVPLMTLDGVNWDHQGVRLACLDYLMDMQGKLISDRIASTGTKTHDDSDINQAAILAFIARENAGDTWDSARIASWFTDSLATYVGVKLLAVNPDMGDADMVKLLAANQTVVVDALSKRKDTVGIENAKKALVRLELVPEGERDIVWSMFAKKLDVIINPPVTPEVKAAIDYGF